MTAALASRGWEIEIFWARPEDFDAGPLDRTGVSGAMGAWRLARRRAREIAAADAVLANGVMGWPVHHPRKVVVFHGNYGGYAQAIRASISRAEYLRLRWVYGGFMAVGGARGIAVEVSQKAAAEIRRLYGLSHVIVIENGVEPGSFAGGDADAARERHALPDGPILLFSGRVEYRKGADVLERLARRVPDGATLVVAGPRLLELPGVVNLGHTPPEHLRDLYAAATLSLQPTRHEGSSFALIEAQDARLPLVTCNEGHVPEMLEREPRLAPTVVDSLDGDAFLNRVGELLRDPATAAELAEIGVRYVRRHHNAETMADRYHVLLSGGGHWRRSR
ncbi:MAG: glycosyltransferase family 4 protein [Thermoleophilia bacterium]